MYKQYKGFPTYREVLKVYTELVESVRNITTIEQALEYQNKSKYDGDIVEINGVPVNEYIKEGGTNEEIEWIRYEYFDCLWYIYCYIKENKVDYISFDVYCEWSDTEFIDSAISLTQEEYYKAIEEHLLIFPTSDVKCIGYDKADLRKIEFKTR